MAVGPQGQDKELPLMAAKKGPKQAPSQGLPSASICCSRAEADAPGAPMGAVPLRSQVPEETEEGFQSSCRI